MKKIKDYHKEIQEDIDKGGDASSLIKESIVYLKSSDLQNEDNIVLMTVLARALSYIENDDKTSIINKVIKIIKTDEEIESLASIIRYQINNLNISELDLTVFTKQLDNGRTLFPSNWAHLLRQLRIKGLLSS